MRSAVSASAVACASSLSRKAKVMSVPAMSLTQILAIPRCSSELAVSLMLSAASSCPARKAAEVAVTVVKVRSSISLRPFATIATLNSRALRSV